MPGQFLHVFRVNGLLFVLVLSHLPPPTSFYPSVKPRLM